MDCTLSILICTLLVLALVETILFTTSKCRLLLVCLTVEVHEHDKEYEAIGPDDDRKELWIRTIDEKKLPTVDHTQGKLGLQINV